MIILVQADVRKEWGMDRRIFHERSAERRWQEKRPQRNTQRNCTSSSQGFLSDDSETSEGDCLRPICAAVKNRAHRGTAHLIPVQHRTGIFASGEFRRAEGKTSS